MKIDISDAAVQAVLGIEGSEVWRFNEMVDAVYTDGHNEFIEGVRARLAAAWPVMLPDAVEQLGVIELMHQAQRAAAGILLRAAVAEPPAVDEPSPADVAGWLFQETEMKPSLRGHNYRVGLMRIGGSNRLTLTAQRTTRADEVPAEPIDFKVTVERAS